MKPIFNLHYSVRPVFALEVCHHVQVLCHPVVCSHSFDCWTGPALWPICAPYRKRVEVQPLLLFPVAPSLLGAAGADAVRRGPTQLCSGGWRGRWVRRGRRRRMSLCHVTWLAEAVARWRYGLCFDIYIVVGVDWKIGVPWPADRRPEKEDGDLSSPNCFNFYKYIVKIIYTNRRLLQSCYLARWLPSVPGCVLYLPQWTQPVLLPCRHGAQSRGAEAWQLGTVHGIIWWGQRGHVTWRQYRLRFVEFIQSVQHKTEPSKAIQLAWHSLIVVCHCKH